MKKQILTLLFGLQLLTIAGTAFANEIAMLPKLKKIVDATKWEYSVTQYGQPSFSVKLDNGDKQEVYIHNLIYTYGNTNYYFVCGTICTTDEKPSETILLDAMTTNGTRFATISLMDREFPHYKGNDNKYSDTAMNSGVLRWGMRATLMCCADSGSEGLKKVISQVAEDANTFKKKHFSKDDAEARRRAETFEIAYTVALEDEDMFPIPEEAQAEMRKKFGDKTTFFLNKKKDIILTIDSSNPDKIKIIIQLVSVQAHPDIVKKGNEVLANDPDTKGRFHESPDPKDLTLNYTVEYSPATDKSVNVLASSILALHVGEKFSEIFRKK